jgi:Rrf2 family nitric oxide-sensitive transcriptional repressor
LGYYQRVRLAMGTDLALRIVMRLAVADEYEEPSTRDVAEAVGVAYSHAVKVVARLQRLGIVDTRRGRGGGLSLSQSGRSQSLGKLVRELEGVGDVVGCEDNPPCPLRSACRLRGLLRTAQEAFYTTLDPVTIEDLARNSTGLLVLMKRPAS